MQDMRKEYLEIRKTLFFETDIMHFVEKTIESLEVLDSKHKKADVTKRNEIVEILENVALDSMSYIPRWHLEKTGGDAQSVLAEGFDKMITVLRKWGEAARAEKLILKANSIRNSNLLKIAEMADYGLVHTRCGLDAAWGLAEAMRYGVMLATTNPVMVNAARKENPELWDPVRDRLLKEYKDKPYEEVLTRFAIEVVYRNCEELYPVFEATKGDMGYVAMQVNPYYATDSAKMVEEVEYVYAALKKKLGRTPNVAFKIPAVEAGLEAVKQLVKKGINVIITACCSAAQHNAFAEVIETGISRFNLLVIMAGRFEDPIIEELTATGIDDAQRIGRYASRALMQRSFHMLENRHFRKSKMIVASIREPINVDSAIIDRDIAYMSIFPKQLAEYELTPRPVYPTINDNIPPEILDALNKSDIFRKGFAPDGMTPSDFIEYPPIAATLSQFRNCYDETKEYFYGK